MLISSNFPSQTRWSIFALGLQIHQAAPAYNKRRLLSSPIIYKVVREQIFYLIWAHLLNKPKFNI